jgi:acyl-CoA synthetase (AMP-forming)/AMP-acid ligase II
VLIGRTASEITGFRGAEQGNQGVQNFVDILSHHAKAGPGKTAFIMLDGSGTETDRLTYAALDHDARSIGTFLRTFLQPERRVLILHSGGLDFIRAFMGCQYADLVAVPLSLPSRHDQYRKRIDYVIKDAGISAIVSDEKWARITREWLAGSPCSQLPVVTVEECRSGAAASWRRPRLDADSVSIIQYTLPIRLKQTATTHRWTNPFCKDLRPHIWWLSASTG